jgi:hypothetical protein
MAPRLIRLPDAPVEVIKVTANSIASGMVAATISPARKSPRSTSRTRMTSAAPSVRFEATVLIVRLTNSDRS